MTSTQKSRESDPLEALRFDAEEMDRRRLADVLQGLVRLDPDHNTIHFESGVLQESTNPQTVLLAVLAQRAMSLMASSESDVPRGLAPAEIQRATGLPGGSVRSAVKRVSDEGLVAKREGHYVVPSHQLEAAEKELARLREGIANT